MSVIKKTEQKIQAAIARAGYELEDFKLSPSNRKDLGDYQINHAFTLGKELHRNPREIAEEIVQELEKEPYLTNLNIAGPGFINLTFTVDFLAHAAQDMLENPEEKVDPKGTETIFLDYGGANIAKTLHVGHLRAANIGEALKRLTRALGYQVISDVHFGDIGRQSGMVISELQRRMPELIYFDATYTGPYPDPLPITAEDLGEIYPIASIAAKEDEERMEEVREITAQLEAGRPGYVALWEKITEISKEDIKGIYRRINTSFDLWEGESDSFEYMDEMLNVLNENHTLIESEGAKVIEIAEETDSAPMPPLVVIKSNGTTLYATRELATLYSRMKRFSPAAVWYVVDTRQDLYFQQVFRAARKSVIVKPETDLEFLGFGTMNGKDGKPFKTRDGGVMTLTDLIELVKEETTKRLNPQIAEQERDDISEMIAISALKYADFLPYRSTDYIFDPAKFADLEGKTGPYLLYSTIRMKSLLKKSQNETLAITKLQGESDREVVLNLLNLPTVLFRAFESKSLNEIAEYLYKLTSSYNKFYSENRILTEEDARLRASWLGLTQVVCDTNLFLLDLLAIKVPEKM